MKRIGLSLLLLLIVVTFFPNDEVSHAAADQNDGVVTEVSGDAYFHKGATSRKIGLNTSDKIQSGDMIYTEKGSHLTLKMTNTGDKIYIQEESQVYFDEKDGNLYVHVLKGDIFVSAEKRASESEALYIVSGKETFKVLGTQFSIFIDPITGSTDLTVFSGIVQARGRNGQESPEDSIYPGQSYNPGIGEALPFDPVDFIEMNPAKIIEAIIMNSKQIQEENEQFLEGLIGNGAVDMPGMTDEMMDRYGENIDALLHRIVNEAMDSSQVDQEELNRIIEEAQFDYDRDKGNQYETEMDERLKEIIEIRKRREEARKEQEERAKELRERIEQENRQAVEEAKRQRDAIQNERENLRERMEEQARERYERETYVPPSRPEPEPEKIEIEVVNVTYDTIEVKVKNAGEEYEVWLENEEGTNIAEPELTSDNRYIFNDLGSGSLYEVFVKNEDEIVSMKVSTKEIEEDPETEYPIAEEWEYLIFNTYQDGFLYIEFEDDLILTEYNDYLIKINNKIINTENITLEDDNNRLKIDNTFEDSLLKIEISLFKDGMEYGYGYVKGFNYSYPGLAVYDITSDSATVTLMKSDIDADNESFNLYKNNELVKTNIKDSYLSGLAADTSYVLKEVLDGNETGHYAEFKTKSTDKDIFDKDFENQKILWDRIAQPSLRYNVFINGNLVEKEYDQSFINYKDIKKINGDVHDIKIVVFEDKEKKETYEWTFEIYLKAE